MRAVLVATDFSGRSARALARGAAIARDVDARLVLAHVVDAETSTPVREAAETAARDELEEIARTTGVPAEIAVLEGEVFWSLREHARDIEAGLIVAGAHRRSPLRDILRDTTVERLARATTTPLLVARCDMAGPYRSAVAGVDPESAAILSDAAIALDGVLPSALVLVHAYDAGELGLMGYARVSPEQLDAASADAAERARRSVEDRWKGARAPVVVAINGQPIAAIDRTLEETQADLLVLATHRRRVVERFFVGSVTSHFLRAGRIDLLIVPPDSHS